jgi:hypothetical protein
MSITRYRGDTKPIVVTLTGATGAINLTGCTGFVLTADPSPDPVSAANNIFALSGTILSATAGTVEFLPSAGQVDKVGVYYFDLQYLDARGLINTAGKDTLTFLQDISK